MLKPLLRLSLKKEGVELKRNQSDFWKYGKLPENYTRKKERKILNWMLPLLGILSFSYLLSFLIRAYFVFPVQLLDHSMEPNIQPGSRVFFSRLDYEIKRGNIIYIQSHSRGLTLVCRVLGLPGESIEIKNQEVYINSRKLETKTKLKFNQQSLPHEILYRDNKSKTTIGKNHYFCLFDNRTHMNDSRSWGAFPKQEISGVLVSKGLLWII